MVVYLWWLKHDSLTLSLINKLQYISLWLKRIALHNCCVPMINLLSRHICPWIGLCRTCSKRQSFSKTSRYCTIDRSLYIYLLKQIRLLVRIFYLNIYIFFISYVIYVHFFLNYVIKVHTRTITVNKKIFLYTPKTYDQLLFAAACFFLCNFALLQNVLSYFNKFYMRQCHPLFNLTSHWIILEWQWR